MKLSDLLPDAAIPEAAKDLCPRLLTASKERIESDSLFFLTEGVSFDKTLLLPFIISKKPLAIVCSSENAVASETIPIITTPNVRKAYAHALYRFSQLKNTDMRLIAVTGTNGKTTTATLLYEILRAEKKSVGFIGTGKILLNGESLSGPFYSMTTPDPEDLYPILKRMEAKGCQFVIMEASSHALALDKLSPLTFSLSVFTNLSCEHLDFHRNMEEYYRAKARLFGMSRHAVLNADDPYARRLAKECTCAVTTVGALFEADATASCVEATPTSGYSFIYKTKGPTFTVKLKIPGIYQIYNSMLAIAAAIELGIRPCRARRAIEKITEIAGRMHCIHAGDISVLSDYAHTPKALACVLKEAASMKNGENELWLIFGCGGERDREKRPKMARIAESLADRVVLTLDNCRNESPMQILKDTVAGFSHRERVRVISNREKAIRQTVLAMKKGDCLIIAGKGHEQYTIDKSGYHSFDEKIVVLNALKERKGGHTVSYEDPTESTLNGR